MKKIVIDAENCIRRARILLKQDKEMSLVYAALELRLGIECRLQQYLEPHGHIPKRCRETYRLNKLNRTILNYLKINDKIVKVTVRHKKLKKPMILYYTPVRPKLVDIGGKLGDYLHCPISSIENLRKLLTKGIEELSLSSMGTLMGPPLGKVENGKPKTMNIISLVKRGEKIPKVLLKKGAELVVDIEYLAPL